MLRLGVFITILCLATPVLAVTQFDPGGPSVDWIGQIVSQAYQSPNTCFELQRSLQEMSHGEPKQFSACVFGSYYADRFQAGHWLEIRGILQPKTDKQLPLVGAASATPIAPPMPPVMLMNAYGSPEFYPEFGGPMMFPGPFGMSPFGMMGPPGFW